MDINSQNPGGDTALHFAAEKGRAETVKLLLERGVGTETTNVDDYTPLHLTAWTAQQGAARALLDAGANLEAPDVEGWTPPPYKVDTSRPSLRTNWTRLVPFPHRLWEAPRPASVGLCRPRAAPPAPPARARAPCCHGRAPRLPQRQEVNVKLPMDHDP